MTNSSSFPAGTVCWIDLAAARVDDAVDFYGRVFGWQSRGPLVADGPRYEQFEASGVPVAGAGELDPGSIDDGVRPVWNVYVAVDDADAAFARGLALGAELVAEPMTFGEAGRAAFLRDPCGATFAVWQALSHRGFGRTREPGSLGWTELGTPDLTMAESFYSGLFGWAFDDLEESPMPFRLIRVRDEPVGGVMQIDPAAGWAWWRDWKVFFCTEDVLQGTTRVREAGGVVRQEPAPTAAGPIAIVEDRDGAPFGLVQSNP